MVKLHSKWSFRKSWVCFAAIVSLGCAFIQQPNNAEALRQIASLIVTTFSFLAGFLIAAIAVVGYSTEVVARHGWQVLEHYRDSFEMRLGRYAAHFVLYLLSIIIVIAWSYMQHPLPVMLWKISGIICSFAMLMAFSLPYEIISQHVSMYDAVIEKAKERAASEDAKEFGEIEDQLVQRKDNQVK